MPYKYNSVLKTFEYSKENYQIISDFLLSGKITDPDILLNVTKITTKFRPSLKPKNWFELTGTTQFAKALIKIKINDDDNKLKRVFKKWALTEGIKTALAQNSDFIDVLNDLNHKQLLKLMKEIGLVAVKKGGKNTNGEALQGTWIHRDLAIEYTRWLDPEFSIWISQKILELVNDGVAWNEIRQQTKIDYKPLTDAIKKYFVPKYSKMQENIIYGQIANYINLRVMKQKAKEIREEKKITENELTRDYFQKLELERIEKVQVFAEILIRQLKIDDFKKLEEMISNYEFD